ncbi:sodium/proline symporter PutP [Brevibacterium salitolerans]|uniref:Sodium/proline symporter n=1 Tax=Brevibacterium salitolerans TaxID=1403566 RepID=A0ABP5I7B0_9MICO
MDLTFKIIAVAIYFAAMIVIGLYAYRKTTDGDDYMLGGRQLHPFTAALSAGASDMSGWLMMGLPGALYLSGMVEAWMAIGLTVGAAVNWWLVAPRLRQYTQIARNSITVPSFFENRLFDRTRLLRIAAGVVILVFFTFYVSSGMVAGGVFFQSTFGGSYVVGMLLVGGVTVLYTLFGGFLGASYTDVVQGLIMLVSLIIVPVVACFAVGGPAEMFSSVAQVNPDFASMTTGTSAIAIISGLAWGVGYFGQPHIIVRFMALRSSRDAKYGMGVGVGWMALCVLGAIFTAIAGVAYFQQNPDMSLSDPEAVFLDLAQIMFHPLLGGFVLAAVLAAIMSTVSSQLIVTSSALVEDLVGVSGKKFSANTELWLGRTGVLVVAVVAGALAVQRNDTILDLVGFAWAGFGAAFGPIVLLSLFWRRLTAMGALVGMVAGAVVAFVWGQWQPDVALGWLPEHLYEIVPGFLVCLLLAVLVSLVTPQPPAQAMEEFERTVRAVKHGEETEEAPVASGTAGTAGAARGGAAAPEAG